MQYFAIALLPIEKADSSAEARKTIYKFLINDRLFEPDDIPDLRFSLPIYTWFVIGGSWSGILNPEKMRNRFFEQANTLYGNEVFYGYYSKQFITENASALSNIWQKLGGKGEHLLSRIKYRDYGYEDDAVIIDKNVVRRLQELNDIQSEILDCSKNNEFGEDVDIQALIGRAWVVVVNYHR